MHKQTRYLKTFYNRFFCTFKINKKKIWRSVDKHPTSHSITSQLKLVPMIYFNVLKETLT